MPYTILTAVFFLFFLLCWLLPLHFHLYYGRQSADDHFVIRATALGSIVHYQLRIPVSQITDRKKSLPWVETEIESRGGETETHTLREQKKSRLWLLYALHNFEGVQKEIDRVLVLLNDYADFMRWATNKIRFERFYWVSRIGLEDAAETAVLVGGCWAIKSYIASALWHRHCCAETRPFIRVLPVYNQQVFHTDFECIFSIRLGHIIGAGIRLMRYKI
ncbi:MAG TPA: hypothetical protein DEA44_01985 [Firmicutes bacterium]|nr:hypothetical protein [Bacillota bacterium]